MSFPLLATMPGGPLGIVALSVVLIVFVIAVLRLHAFFALILAAMVVALLSGVGGAGELRLTKAVEAVMTEFGSTTGKLGFAIALAAVIGIALMESGAADKIVRRLIAVLGENSAAFVLCGCSFVLAGPVFVDTVFMLMLPLARALALRTGRNYLLYVMAIGAGAVIANGVVPPAPGPLFVANALKLNLGHAILAGLIFGLPPALGGLAVGYWFNKRITIPPRPLNAQEAAAPALDRPESELPGFWISITPVVLPLALITIDALAPLAKIKTPGALTLLHFLGNKNIALLIGAVIALWLQASRKKISWRGIGALAAKPLETGGVIILIVAAGGAYGGMIKQAGVGDQLKAFALGSHPNHPTIAHLLTSLIHHHVLLAWVITALIRGAQGSATVATIAGVGIMTSIAGTTGFNVHPLYIMMAIGFGSKCLPWMNDAGFWVVSRMSGLTQGEMLRTWSPVLTIISIFGLIEVLVLANLFPNLPFSF